MALKQLVRDINGSGERVALYCSLETLQNVMDVASAMSTVETVIWKAVRTSPVLAGIADGIRRDAEPVVAAFQQLGRVRLEVLSVAGIVDVHGAVLNDSFCPLTVANLAFALAIFVFPFLFVFV